MFTRVEKIDPRVVISISASNAPSFLCAAYPSRNETRRGFCPDDGEIAVLNSAQESRQIEQMAAV